MSNPALAIDDKVVSVGKVLLSSDIEKLLQQYKQEIHNNSFHLFTHELYAQFELNSFIKNVLTNALQFFDSSD